MKSEGPMGKLRAQSGFSLIELVITVSIIAVVLAVLLPGIRQATDSFQLRKAASITVAELRRAQAEATARGVDVLFEFDTTGTSSYIRYWAMPAGTEIRAIRPPEWPSAVQFRPGTGFANCTTPADTGHKCVTFKPLGYVDNGGDVMIRSRPGGEEWSIVIATATGKVSVVR